MQRFSESMASLLTYIALKAEAITEENNCLMLQAMLPNLYAVATVFDGLRFWFGLAIIIYLVTALVFRGKRPKTPVWSIMAFASFMTIAFGLLSVDEVVKAVDLDVILFLIGMFSLVSLANSSGLLDAIAYWLASRFRTTTGLVYGSALLFGLLAAFVVNDTVALIGPPIAYSLSKIGDLDPKMMFLLLAFSLTIGSVMTLIGNPQNVLVAVESGVPAPFIAFVKTLVLPTIVNLVVTAWMLMKVFRVEKRRIEVGLIPHEAV